MSALPPADAALALIVGARRDGDLPARPAVRRTTLVIRGDLTSATGYGEATRSLARLLRPAMRLWGVDLHAEPGAAPIPFPGALVSDGEVAALCAQPGERVIVLNYTTPDGFRPVFPAVNIGCFYWETSALPFAARWRERIAAMDALWAPSRYVAQVMRAAGCRRPIDLVTWPMDFDARPALSGPSDAASLRPGFIDVFDGGAGAPAPLAQVRAAARTRFRNGTSMAPRQGRPILLTEWRDHLERGGGAQDVLLLKLRFVHNSRLGADPQAHMAGLLRQAGFRPGAPARIAWIGEDLSAARLAGLFALADGYVTASYGEGFGGPVVEALLHGAPVIAARHTGVSDLLAPDYPLALRSHPQRVGLRGAPAVYPHASAWEIPERGEIAAALGRLAAMAPETRRATRDAALAHARAFCGQAAVRAQLDAALDRALAP